MTDTWYGKEFTKKGAVLMLFLLVVYAPLHEFGHWFAYWMFGIPSTLGIFLDPFPAIYVQALISVDLITPIIKEFVFFFGGGFAGMVFLMVSIKSRPALIAAGFGVSGGITEWLFHSIGGTTFIQLVDANALLYISLTVIPVVLLFIVGLPEFRRMLYMHNRDT